MKTETKTMVTEKRERKCKICGTQRGLIRKYNLMICRRCFKEQAPKLGFYKYG